MERYVRIFKEELKNEDKILEQLYNSKFYLPMWEKLDEQGINFFNRTFSSGSDLLSQLLITDPLSSYEKVKYLASHKDFDSNAVFSSVRDNNGNRSTKNNTYIHVASSAYTPYTIYIDLLIKQGVNINAKNSLGLTALDIAYENKQDKLIQYLIKKGGK